MPEGLNPEDLKKSGFIKQKQPDLYSVRLRIPVGNLTSDQLCKIAEVSKEFGTGRVHITARQSLEIRNIPLEKIDYLVKSLDEVDLQPGSCGPRVRNIVACGGNRYCQHGLTDSEGLAYDMDKHFFGRELPRKIKIGVSGCPNSCSKPQENDIGLVGKIRTNLNFELCAKYEDEEACGLCVEVCEQRAITIINGKPAIDYSKCQYDGICLQTCPYDAWSGVSGYTVFMGGKIGKYPQLGYKIIDFIPEEEREFIFEIIERTIKFFGEESVKKERLGTFINRLGIQNFKREILSGVELAQLEGF